MVAYLAADSDDWHRTGIDMTKTTANDTPDPLAGKTLVILGLARQGKALARFAAERSVNVIVSDLRSAETLSQATHQLADFNIRYVFGNHPLSLLDEADVLAISGSVPADAPFINAARERGIPITNDSQEFLRRSPVPTIGITGSAGKSTTTSLVGAMSQADGKPTLVGGNLGFPLLEKITSIEPDSVVVQELSSFQLEIWQQSPHIATILNITPNHLDRHKTMAVYTEAKANILRFQTNKDIAVLPARGLEKLFPLVKGRLRLFGDGIEIEDGASMRGGNIIVRDGEQEWIICQRADIKLRGKHNLLNVLAAVTLADSAGISHRAMRQAIATFTGIAHRLELVATVAGVQYVNDSIATAPERAIAAINAFDEPLILLTGGRDKNLMWDEWARLVRRRCKAVILFGELRALVGEQLANADLPVYQVVTLDEAVSIAAQESTEGDVVLLSPGGTSYDAYVDFAERGEHFRHLVERTTNRSLRKTN